MRVSGRYEICRPDAQDALHPASRTSGGVPGSGVILRHRRRTVDGGRAGFEVIAEGFNVLNRANLQLPNNVYGTGPTPNASFGLPTAADNPRQVQFGLRLDF